ncbi:glutathione S-transferase family protein [Anabaena cylindrica FACHB-243]|uniref:Glutathione S-transferase domain protein n=1 Tax=Anabaena cylindrica (strain ATCC 27899 / PCC 7122) TaxID=272123 RepID=K9ZIC4_ANACC|nr:MULTISPECIES: glutathione S-transferase family protein [Anabaena]AFZ58519.1 Glutathione S-transferase domain protein [Anabaena cylindrica PCC 7122]MBD2416281.1 glutathione S-transferase family protein [Anabaena cylindrica FACHB-243]MBY5283270.1 glutathione S-transferase family protein [Anabaena sp. CCAP 1446/1C]MBY5307951.1 glutathione S-transferase family protein [Anabaena sp. CCAP 1446/1C]BAY04481.1 glutathione S-transferase N-terminal domain protein [Anabaena cylindrica PCC 7122]
MCQILLRKFFLPTSAVIFTFLPIQPLQALPLLQSDFTQLSESSQKPTKPTKLQLYGGPQTRTPIIQWYLEELGVSYDYISLNIGANEQRQPEFLAINPMGKVPAIVDGDLKLWESGAILLYLAEKYQQMPNSLAERAKIEQWVIFANATLAPALFSADKREKEMPILLTPLNKILQQKQFLLGEKLSVGDIAVASYLHYAKVLLSLDYRQYPSVVAYLERIAARPAFKNTLGKR